MSSSRNRVAPSVGTALVVALTGLSFAPPSAAAEPAVELTWEAPSGCPDQATVRAEIARLLGPQAQIDSGEPVAVTAMVEPDPADSDAWHVRIEVASAAERRLHASRCGVLAGATALVVAMMIDPLAVADAAPQDLGSGPGSEIPPPKPPNPDPPNPDPPQPEPAPAPPTPPTPTPEHPVEPVGFIVGASLASSLGALPGVAWGLGVELGVMSGPLRLDLALLGYPAQRSDVVGQPGVGAEIDLVTARLAARYLLLKEPLEVGPSLGIDIGSLAGTAAGVTHPQDDGSAWITPFAGGLVAWPIHPQFALRAHAAIGWASIRPTFVVAPYGTVHEVAGPVGLGEFAAEARFW